MSDGKLHRHVERAQKSVARWPASMQRSTSGRYLAKAQSGQIVPKRSVQARQKDR